MVDYVDMLPLGEPLREAIRDAVQGRAAAWPALSEDAVRAIEQHGLAPLLYALGRLPELRGAAVRAAAVESLRASDVANVLGALAPRGVVPLIVKGSALAYDLYPAPELRPRGDTDLLIARRDLDALREAMSAIRFDELPTSGDELALRQVTFLRRDAYGVEHAYDVHWAIANTPVFASTLEYDDLLARAIALPRLGEQARGLCDADALLLACVHRVAHHHGTDRLIWLYDIHLLHERMTADAHRDFWTRAADREVVGICDAAIGLASGIFGAATHDRASDWLPAERVARRERTLAFPDGRATRAALLVQNLAALSWRQRARRLRQLAFPPAAFMLHTFPNRGRASLPLLYAWRAMRGVARLFRRIGA